MSGERESNPLHSPWEGDILPVNYRRESMSGGKVLERFLPPRIYKRWQDAISSYRREFMNGGHVPVHKEINDILYLASLSFKWKESYRGSFNVLSA